MTRLSRSLSVMDSPSKSSVAEPPEAITIETNLVIILAALLCALICVVGLTAILRCAWFRHGSTGEKSTVNKGLKKKVVQSLPKLTYNAAANGKLTVECPICLAEYSEGDEIRVLPQCGHGFHVGCVDKWLGKNSSCPSCRQVLVVTRCEKCGELPAVSSEVKVMQEGRVPASPALYGGFLP